MCSLSFSPTRTCTWENNTETWNMIFMHVWGKFKKNSKSVQQHNLPIIYYIYCYIAAAAA